MQTAVHRLAVESYAIVFFPKNNDCRHFVYLVFLSLLAVLYEIVDFHLNLV